ncbi:hypothetical protein HK100_006034, partial [Physocladia obscura]
MSDDATLPLVSSPSGLLLLPQPTALSKLQFKNIWKPLAMFSMVVSVGYIMVLVQLWSDDTTLRNANGQPLIPLRDVVYEQFVPEWLKDISPTT